jgi:hypothetical protein
VVPWLLRCCWWWSGACFRPSMGRRRGWELLQQQLKHGLEQLLVVPAADLPADDVAELVSYAAVCAEQELLNRVLQRFPQVGVHLAGPADCLPCTSGQGSGLQQGLPAVQDVWPLVRLSPNESLAQSEWPTLLPKYCHW